MGRPPILSIDIVCFLAATKVLVILLVKSDESLKLVRKHPSFVSCQFKRMPLDQPCLQRYLLRHLLFGVLFSLAFVTISHSFIHTPPNTLPGTAMSLFLLRKPWLVTTSMPRLAASKIPSMAAELQRKLISSSTVSTETNIEELMSRGRTKTSFKNSMTIAMKKKYPIDAALVKEQISLIKMVLGVSEFQVDVWFCSDTKMMQLNKEWRNQRKSTDILSFPANEFVAPGVFADDISMEIEKHLGDLVISPAYVMKVCSRDEADHKLGILDDDEDAGVSKAMSTVFTLEERIPLLLVHGMLHLIG